jgi:hypothetical protein
MKRLSIVLSVIVGLAAMGVAVFAQNAGQPRLEQGITYTVADGIDLTGQPAQSLT